MHDPRPPEPSSPLPSSTVILIRESAREGFKVFLMRRHKRQEFMGGVFVFPGGKLEPQDCSPEVASACGGLTGLQARKLLQEPELEDQTALGLFLAAIRETFEEAGVLLAHDASGALVSFREGESLGRFSSHRLRFYEDRLTLPELAREEGLTYAPELLAPYAHWITPVIEPKRFSTRFFLARHPAGQLPFHDTIEMTESRWLRPAEALDLHRQGQILLMPPTLKTLEELAAFEDVEALFAHALRREIRPIMPEAFRDGDVVGVRLPNDPDYTVTATKQTFRPGEPSRIVLRDGRWRTESWRTPS